MTSQPEKSSTLYARLPSDVMGGVRTHATAQGMTLSAAAADLLRRGLMKRTGSYKRGYRDGFAAATAIVDLLANADEHAARIKAIGDNFAAALEAVKGGAE